MTKSRGNYRGWAIRYFPAGALHWRAARRGVSMTGISAESLRGMIDIRAGGPHAQK